MTGKPAATGTPPAFDPLQYRPDFPGLARTIHGKPLVYLDNANTAQRPQAVIDAVDGYYLRHNANVSRAVHTLGTEATALYEGTRDKLRADIQPVPPAQLMRFLFRWHQLASDRDDERREGESGLANVLRQLEGQVQRRWEGGGRVVGAGRIEPGDDLRVVGGRVGEGTAGQAAPCTRAKSAIRSELVEDRLVT